MKVEELIHTVQYVVNQEGRPTAVQLSLEAWQEIETLLQQLIAQPTTADAHDLALQKEMLAFERLHPLLYPQYANQFVAIHQGQLVDADVDVTQLYVRIEEKFPTETVLITPVNEEIVETISFRSPRLIE
jgi:hypothetical protein